MSPKNPNRITITVASAEGDTAEMELNVHQHVRDLLREALKALYGNPVPDADGYDVVIGGTIADLDQTLIEAGLVDGAEVAVLPKDVSRG